jgi:hypothetical protein
MPLLSCVISSATSWSIAFYTCRNVAKRPWTNSKSNKIHKGSNHASTVPPSQFELQSQMTSPGHVYNQQTQRKLHRPQPYVPTAASPPIRGISSLAPHYTSPPQSDACLPSLVRAEHDAPIRRRLQAVLHPPPRQYNSRSFARPRTGSGSRTTARRDGLFRRDMSCRARRTGRLQPDRRQGAGLTPEGREVGTADQAPRGTVMKQVGYLCMGKGPARDVWESLFFLLSSSEAAWIWTCC